MAKSTLTVGTLLAILSVGIWSAATVDPGSPGRSLPGGWGVDAGLSVHVAHDEVGGFLDRLRDSGIRWLRERSVGGSFESGTDGEELNGGRLKIWDRLRKSGFRVLAFASLPEDISADDADNQLPEDLMAVFEQSRRLAILTADHVDAWEMSGEPDVAFVKDLPDRLAAFDKAVYLGLKAGSRSRKGVLMGALALPPGPWLERAARNGLFDYTDGLNFHFYGLAADLAGSIEAHRDTARVYTQDRNLPVWITECGLDAAPPDRLDEPHARELQSKFTIDTAAIARDKGVGVFMPFILTFPGGSGFSLMASSRNPYPAWEAYSDFTRKYAFSSTPAFAPPQAPSPIVLQWMPDNETCIAHKVGGVYWFAGKDGSAQPICGEIVAYNFSKGALRGRLKLKAGSNLQVNFPGSDQIPPAVLIPPFGRLRIPVRFRADTSRYWRDEVEVSFLDEDRSKPSRLMFALGTRPTDALLPGRLPIEGKQPGEKFAWIWAPEPYRVTSRCGPWLGVNGVSVTSNLKNDETFAPLDAGWRFQSTERQSDPRLPPMAIAKIDGLPDIPNGFLRLRFLGDASHPAPSIRVDLVDRFGQRFSISENMGRNGIDPEAATTFLSYRDFHLYIWGRCLGASTLRPKDIREIQLRFYGKTSMPREVSLDAVAPVPKTP